MRLLKARYERNGIPIDSNGSFCDLFVPAGLHSQLQAVKLRFTVQYRARKTQSTSLSAIIALQYL